MSEVSSYSPGTFCWPELATSDQQAASGFYTALFNWTANEMPIGDAGTYTMLQLDGLDVAALNRLEQDARDRGVPPHWNSYVSVASADDTVARARDLGGKVLAGPFDVFDAGRMAVLQDPTGAVVSLWQPKRHIGARRLNEQGALCWNELATSDPAAAERFYTRLFGWTADTHAGPMPYTEFMLGGRAVGGMLKLADEWGAPPHWLVYFASDNPDQTAARARELGASLKVPPTDIPKVGRFAVIQDPQGAVFAIIKVLPHH